VRDFEAILFGYVGQRVPLCTYLVRCGDAPVVEHNGDVYSCDFYVEPEHKLGNIREGRIKAMLSSSQQKAFGGRKRDLDEECRACPWLARCHGGCLKDRDRGESGRTPYCAAYKRFFEHADPELRRLADAWQTELRQRPGQSDS